MFNSSINNTASNIEEFIVLEDYYDGVAKVRIPPLMGLISQGVVSKQIIPNTSNIINETPPSSPSTLTLNSYYEIYLGGEGKKGEKGKVSYKNTDINRIIRF